MEKYKPGEKVTINIDALISGDAELDYVEIVTEHGRVETWYYLYNDDFVLCCCEREPCTIERVINSDEYNPVYELKNTCGGNPIFFWLSKNDLDIATSN